MATIKLAIVGDTQDVYKKIGELESYAKSMKPIQLKFSAVGLNEVSKNALALAKAQAQVEISANKAAEAEARARKASLDYGKVAEQARVQEKRRNAEIEAGNTALKKKELQEEKTRTATQQHATQVEKTKTAEVNRRTAVEKSTAALASLRGEQDKTASSSSNLFGSITKVGDAYTKLWSRITSTITRRVINQAFTALRSNIKETLDVMKAVDTQLINIQKVSGKTSEEIAAIGERAYDTAAKYGVAVDDYLSAVYSFQKAGLGENAEELAELATKTMLVGDTTSTVAEKFLVSANAAWELHGNVAELNKVIDEADYINNNYATTLDKIAAGLPIVASVAANAGMSYSETMAALGTITSVTQESGTKAATALRALILNIEGEVGSYLTEEGEEFEVTAESVKSMQGLLEKYAKTEMDAARAAGELINPMTAIKALFEGMSNSDLSDVELFQLLSGMGGKLRTNQLTALVKNFGMFDEMLVQLGDSAGTADREVELMLGSWEKKAQILKDRWTQFIAGLVSTDEIKGLIDDITEFVTNLDPQQIGAAIRDTLYPIIDLIRNVDWAGAAQSISSIFDKIMSVAKGGAIAATVAIVIGGVQKIISFLGTIGGLLGIGGFAGVAAGGGIIGGLVLIGTLIKPLVDHAINVDRLTESADRLTKTVKEQTKQFANSKAEIDSAGTVVGIYIDRLEELEKQGLDTKEAQDEYQNILDQIVTIMPELSGAVEKANGQYENFSATLRDNADAWIANATAQAYKAEIESVAAAKASAEFEKAKNDAELGEINKTLAVYDAITKEAEKLAARIENGDFANNDEWLAAKARLEELGQKTWELGADSAIQEALARRGELQEAIEEDQKKIDAANAELERARAAYDSLQEEISTTSGGDSGSKDPRAAWKEQEAERRRAAAATQETKAATQAATQAENEYAEAATNSGSAASQAATLTATAVREDTVPALKEVKEALDAIPEEKSITIVPHFENALAAIQRYVNFLGYLKENYSSTLTSTITHDDREHGKFTQETFSGASGIPARAGGDSNFPGGPTLVNELGPELISENGRAFIAGGGKPTVVDLAPGAIVIPADQTRQALKGGLPRYAAAQMLNLRGFSSSSFSTGDTRLDDRFDSVRTNISIQAKPSKINGGTEPTGGKGGKGGTGGRTSSSSNTVVTVDFSALEKNLSDLLKNLDLQAQLAHDEERYEDEEKLYQQAQDAIADLVAQYRKQGYKDDSNEILTLLNKGNSYASKTPVEDALDKALKDRLNLISMQSKLAEDEGKLAEMVALNEEAQRAISETIEQYRKRGYGDDSEEILSLLNKLNDYRDNDYAAEALKKATSEINSQLNDRLKILELQAKLAEDEGDIARVVQLNQEAQRAITDAIGEYRNLGYGDDSEEILSLLSQINDYSKKTPLEDALESALSERLRLLELQASLASNKGDLAQVVELYQKAREAIAETVDEYKALGYGDDSAEVIALLNQNFDYANKQLDIYQNKFDELVNALQADTDATKAAKALEDKRIALEEAQTGLSNAQKQRTVRIFNAATGQWEWIADEKQVQSARDAVTSAEEAYAEEVRSQAIAELKKMGETVSDLSDVVLGPALSAVVTMAESSEEFQNFAKALNAVFGIGSFLQSTEGTTRAISTTDSHDNNYSFGGVSLSEEQAGSMSLKQLAQLLNVLKIT